MGTAHLFSYNLFSNGVITGCTQYGDMAVSLNTTDTSGFTVSNMGNPYHGPDEDFGYVIAYSSLAGTRTHKRGTELAPDAVSFIRSNAKTYSEFKNLVSIISGTTQVSAETASDWLLANEYWTSWVSIVTSGLQLNLDAGNINSYPGTGTTWYDLSSNGNNGTLVSDPTFTSTNGGSFIFNGVDEFVRVVDSGFFSTASNSFFADTGYAWTVSAWFKFPVSPVGTRTGNASFTILGQSGGVGGGETLTLYVSSGTDSTYGTVPYYLMVGIRGTKTTISTVPVNTGLWNQVVVTWNGTSGRAYLNGDDRGATNIGAVAIQTLQYFDIANTGDSGAPGNSTQQFEGNISNVLVYNKALSAEEVTQNYTAQEGRND